MLYYNSHKYHSLQFGTYLFGIVELEGTVLGHLFSIFIKSLALLAYSLTILHTPISRGEK